MSIKKFHHVCGLFIATFLALHLYNHIVSIYGVEAHIATMNKLRVLYRYPLFEIVLLAAVLIQIYTGITFFIQKRKNATGFFAKLHIYSGLYLAFFFTIHISAILSARYFLKLDTNIYFGVAGLNIFPYNLFFFPYYAFAIFAFFGHIAAIHHKKMKYSFLGLTPKHQAIVILIVGLCIEIIIFYGLTNKFMGINIPKLYQF